MKLFAVFVFILAITTSEAGKKGKKFRQLRGNSKVAGYRGRRDAKLKAPTADEKGYYGHHYYGVRTQQRYTEQ